MEFQSQNSSPNKSINPSPPENLSKETIGVWSGWCLLGDREVAREAAAKGLHVNLAITFLSTRKNFNTDETTKWFKNEILNWVGELLDRQQIFKASHILNNVQFNPTLELSKIFRTTNDGKLREYIGNHLLKMEKMENKLRALWHFFKLYVANKRLLAEYQLENESIESLDMQNNIWKSKAATILFVKTSDVNLLPFITPEEFWKYLLKENNLNYLLAWINYRFIDNYHEKNIQNSVKELFSKSPISSEMLNFSAITEFEISNETKCRIYDEFSKYGMFCGAERNDFLAILTRLINSRSLKKLYEILSQPYSNIKNEHFLKLLITYCLKNELFNVLNACIKNNQIPQISVDHQNGDYLNLISNFRSLVNRFDDSNLRDNIFQVAKVLSHDLNNYFVDNPIILLALVLFTKNTTIFDIQTGKSSLIINDTNLDETLIKILPKLPILNTICNKKAMDVSPNNLNIYQLLEIHLKIDPKNYFQFRFDNKPVPNFNSLEVMQEKSGYSKKINYLLYLKQCRPSFASKLFILNQFSKYGCIKESDLNDAELKVSNLALKHFDSIEITSSCFSFLEMIELNSEKLKINIIAASFILKAGYDSEYIRKLFTNPGSDLNLVRDILEKILIDKITDSIASNEDFQKMIESMKKYKIVVTFAKIHKIKLPVSFLKYCACNNLWMPFLIFSQIHSYPLDQMTLVVQFFKSPNLLEHINHSIISEIQITEADSLMRDRDSRKYLLSKIGLGRNNNSNANLDSSEESLSSCSAVDFFEIDISNIKATLLQTLIRCHNSTDPPRALLQASQLYKSPLLAIFANSYEPDSIITNWLTWLAVSCDLCDIFTNYEAMATSAISVANLLENCMKNGYPKALYESFEIFLPDHPLKMYIAFLNCLMKLNFVEKIVLLKLEKFQMLLSKNVKRDGAILYETDFDMTYLINRLWIEKVALRLLAAVLNFNCSSLYQQILIVQFLDKIKIMNFFSIQCPSFGNMLQILRILFESNTKINLNISFYFDNQTNRQAIVNCINSLLDKHYYETALKIARVEHLPPDLILVREWQNKFNNRSKTLNDKTFWDECNEKFKEMKVTADCVIEFYLDCLDKLEDNYFEIYLLSKLACEWSIQFDLSNQYDLELKMWLAYLKLEKQNEGEFEHFVTNNKAPAFLYRDMAELVGKVPAFEGNACKESKRRLDNVLIFSLNCDNFWVALKLQKMFGFRNEDLECLKLLYALAENIITPYDFNAEQQLIVSKIGNLQTYPRRRILIGSRLSSIHSSTPDSQSSSQSPQNSIVEIIQPPTNETLPILQGLSDHIVNGKNLSQTIFMIYRISVNIEVPYEVVIATSNCMKLLKDSLEHACVNKLDVVHDFVTVNKWSKIQIADLICEELINAACVCVEKNLDQFIMWDLYLDQEFHLILQLIQDSCSLLGHKIYSYLNVLHKSKITSIPSSQTSSKEKTILMQIIELLIRSHDCFTVDCNMEGISMILKKCQNVISHLLVLKNWKLIVRLLTGVARYTEMSYVFQILQQNDHFEFLLRKGSRKDNALKIALLDYLKKYCPENKDLYKIVALHFTLFSEVALLWENEAQNIVNNLISVSILEMQNNKLNLEEEGFVLFTKNDGTHRCLNKAMENYIHATDFHLQGEKLSKAMNSAKQAELIALQLSVLKKLPNKATTECLLNLSSRQIIPLLTTRLSFEQALILIETYNFHVDWSIIIYEQFIKQNNIKYMESFMQHFPLSESFARDISRRFISERVNSVEEIQGMKFILRNLPSVHMKYRIASEVGFTDIIEELMEGNQLVYLKDTVWKKGYKK